MRTKSVERWMALACAAAVSTANAGAVAGLGTQAPAVRMPGPAELAREQEKVEIQRKELFDKRNLATQPGKNMFPAVPTPERASIDIETIAKQYGERAAAVQRSEDLFVFASFSMPPESLKRAIASAGRVGGAVVLRGFKNDSYRETAQALQKMGVDTAHVLINPTAFTKYKIKAVPTTVLVKQTTGESLDRDGCATPDTFVAVGGDVTLRYAMEDIGKRSPNFRGIAERYARQLQD